MGCMVGVETAAFPGQTQEEIDRLLHMVGFVTIFASLGPDMFRRLLWVAARRALNSGSS